MSDTYSIGSSAAALAPSGLLSNNVFVLSGLTISVVNSPGATVIAGSIVGNQVVGGFGGGYGGIGADLGR